MRSRRRTKKFGSIEENFVMSFEKIVEICSFLLERSPLAEDCRRYLDGRLSRKTQKLFDFGYYPNDLNILFSLVGEDILRDTGLLTDKNIYDISSPKTINMNFFEQHSLVMPYRDAYGNIISIVGRTLFNEKERQEQGISKYKNTVFTKGNHLFGLFEAKKSILQKSFAYVVEGQFDVIKAFEKGIYNVVAAGSANLTSYQLALLSRYTDHIIVAFDNDEAGEQGRQSINKKMANLVHNMWVETDRYLPEGYKDVCEFLEDERNNEIILTTL